MITHVINAMRPADALITLPPSPRLPWALPGAFAPQFSGQPPNLCLNHVPVLLQIISRHIPDISENILSYIPVCLEIPKHWIEHFPSNSQVKTLCLEGRVSQKFCILPLVPWGIIYGGNIIETARSDLKMVQNCKSTSLLGLEITSKFPNNNY